MTDLEAEVRAPQGTGEWRLIEETCCRVRQPRAEKGDVIPWAAWEPMYAPAVEAATDGGLVLVADLSGVAVGFVVVSGGGRLFMLYVKREYRGNGYGLALLRAAMPLSLAARQIPVTADMLTPAWRRWCRDKGLAFELPNGGRL